MHKLDLSFLSAFARKVRFSFLPDVLELDRYTAVPPKRGVYIFVSQNQEFVYPEGNSRVFYIGKSDNLRRRIREHSNKYLTVCEETQNDFFSRWEYGRYYYAKAYGCDAYYMPVSGVEESKDLESKIMECFYNRYKALPVGNGAFSYR